MVVTSICARLPEGSCMQNCLTRRSVLPIGQFLRLAFHCGEVAQLGEHRLRKAGVEGSNPFFSTTNIKGLPEIGNPFFIFPNTIPNTPAKKLKQSVQISQARCPSFFERSRSLQAVSILNSSAVIPTISSHSLSA